VVSTPLLQEDRVIFVTLTPNAVADACTSGGSSWLMELDALSGSRLDTTPFELNGDGVFTADEYVVIATEDSEGNIVQSVPGSGIRYKDDIIGTPTDLVDVAADGSGGGGGCKYIYVLSNGQSIEAPCGVRFERQSWRQLR